MQFTIPLNVAYSVLSFALFVFALMVHEIAHGAAALACGDPTARDRGRLTLNPIKHADLVGSVMLPLLLFLTGAGVMFGWAKPVPIALYRCRNPRRALWIVAIAGPLSNLVQAVLGAIIFRAIANSGAAFPVFWQQILLSYICANLVLMAFNLIPIPPLDGSRVLESMMSPKWLERFVTLERWSFLIVLALSYFGAFDGYLNVMLKTFLNVLFR